MSELSSPSAPGDFLADVLNGLSLPQKRLSPKYFYDQRGSELFDAITELEEYYPTRTELAIMERNLSDIVALLGRGVRLVEFGSGSSVKTRLLLDAMDHLASYVPVDISCEHLERIAEGLRTRYPDLPISPACADYSQDFVLPETPSGCLRTVVYFPGSTIGNFDPEQARQFLARVMGITGPGGGLLIGVDLKKDPAVIERAYNDAEGITAEFNRNLLRRMNAELGGTFDLERFEHRANYAAGPGRIEMHLVSTVDQRVLVGGRTFAFRAGESIFTEASHKFTLEEFARLASDSWQVIRVFVDEERLFSVQYLEAVSASG